MYSKSDKFRIFIAILFVLVAVGHYFIAPINSSKIMGIRTNVLIWSTIAILHCINLYIHFKKNRKPTQIENNEKNN